MKARTHRVIVTVTFDKPVSRGNAIAAVRDNVYGEFYPSFPDTYGFDPKYPETFKIRSVKSAGSMS